MAPGLKESNRRVRRTQRNDVHSTLRPVRTAHPTAVAAGQHGYILLPVVLLITLISVVAFLLNHESALGTGTTGSLNEAQQADYVARAGLNHGLWQSAQQGCGPYTDVTSQALANDNYSTILTTDLGSTTAYSLTVDQDTWIRNDWPTHNKATDSKLHIRYEAGNIERPMYRYDLSPLPANATILSATAWFYVSKEHPAGPVDIHRLTADWAENDATWDSMGANMDSAVLTTIPSQPLAGVWVQVNLTSQVQAWVNGQPNYGITLNSTSEGTHGDYASREAAQQPYLEVVVGTPPPSPATLQAVGTLDNGNGISRTISRDDVALYQQPQGFVRWQHDAIQGVDAYIWENNPTTQYGNDDETWVSRATGSSSLSLFRFKLGALPAGIKIHRATLSLLHESGNNSNVPVTAHRIVKSWNENFVTWRRRNNGDNWDNFGGDLDDSVISTTLVGPASGIRYEWDLTSLVQGWVDNTYGNHGVALRTLQAGSIGERFYTSDHADPTRRPRLTVTYSCLCGQVCAAPQGSGNILMVVSDEWAMTDDETAKQALFEGWGYTVDLISQWDVDWNFDAKAVNNDVVYVSEAVTATTFGMAPKLAATSLGVINEEGRLNDELGMAAGLTRPVGDSISITDTSHYITQPFAAGSLPIFSAPMEGLTVSGSEAGGLQTLADWGGAGSLVVLDTGAALEGGGSAPGRRVMLPLGRDQNFNPDYLNNNGRLIVQRAIQWGVGNVGATPSLKLLFVAGDSVASANEQARIALIESWGYDVTLIADHEPQADFDAAVSVNDVAYVSQEVRQADLGSKLTGAVIGVVNEDKDFTDDFGFADGSYNMSNQTGFDIVDNTHYITSPFATGILTFGSSQTIAVISNLSAISPELQVLAATGSGSIDPAVSVLEAGAATWDGGSTPGRRALLPWGSGVFDINGLDADGQTLTRRAIEWAGGVGSLAGPFAHWKLDETSGTTAVDSEGGHHGTLTNSPSWDNGIIDGALAFDGFDDYVDLTSDADLDDVFLGGATVMAWVYAESWGGNNYGRILDKSSELGGDRDGWMIGLYGDNQAVSLAQGFTGGRGFWRPQNGTFPLNEWVHVAFVYDSSSDANDPVIYLNGVAQSSLVEISPSGTIRSDASISLRMGNHAQDTSRSFDGKLDDVRIYDRMLSDAEIAELATAGGSAQTVLLVVGDAATLAGKDAGYKALMESWGHTVNLIDDGDSQTNFNTAMAAADVVYVSGTSSGPALLDKVTGTTTGVVNEINGKLDNFGFSSSTASTVNTDTFSKTDAPHYITEPFSGNPVTVFTASLTNPVPGGTLAPDLSNVGEVSGTPALVTLDAGASRYDGNPAPARRVHLPFASAETTDLTADGQTILQRALEWAAGAGAGGGGGGSGSPSGGVVFEEFSDASRGSNGKSMTVSKPGGTTAGDLLIAALVTDGNQETWTPPSAGWNLIDAGTQSEEVSLAVWWKLAGSVEPASYNFTWPEDQEAYAWMMRFTGHDPANPINVSSNAGGSSSSPSSPAVTTTVVDTMILRIGGFDDDDISVGVPGLSGHTAITMGKSDTGNGTCSGGAGYLTQSAAGSSGTSTFSLTRSEQYRAVTIGIAPAP